MKTLKILSVFFLLLVSTAYAQQTGVSGTIIEKATNEPLIGVSVILSNGKGAVTDIAGKFFIAADSGNYTAKISYIGYAPQTVNVTVGKTSSPISVSLEPVTLTEVEIVADVATTRKTPIAFTNIDSKKIEEELAGRDVPMLLATTPGVYGTMQGGGIGDSRVTIRGFDQRNIGVLVDGIPINDMENASVYWSDFDGLPAVTRTIQIQRGLGASKLAIASVGGTINVITKGIEDKKFISYSQEYGSDMLLKETLALSTGKMKGGWGITASGTRKTGDGWVAQTPIQEWAYFVKAEKRFKKHLISASANSAPQIHGQRSWQQPILTYDKKFAAKLGIDTSKNGYLAGTPTGAATPKSYSYGIDYNSHWGNIDRWTGNINPNTGKIIGDTLSHNKSKLNDAVNYFNNPIYNLNDYWNISEKLYLSTVLYASYGTGGGTSLYNNAVPVFASTGQYNFQSVYDNNYTSKWGVNPTIAPGHKSSNFIKSAVNNHVWYGGLMTLTYKLNKNITITTGPDIRWYNGTHYWKVYDLMGGDYALDPSVGNGKTPLRVGDIFNHNYSSYINYEGAFVQSEYVKNKVSAFITATGVETSYQRVDNFDTSSHNKSPIIKFPGYSVKAGANYNIDEHHNVYVNSGYIIKAPPFNNVFYNSNVEEWGVKPQKIASVEAGYGFHTRLIAANLNTYYTSWMNKPLDYTLSTPPDSAGHVYYYNVNGMNALHKGVELDLLSKPTKKITVGGILSIGDWRWMSKDTAKVYDNNNNLVQKVGFDARNVHVGNAPQSQYGLNVRYEPIKNLYFKVQWTYYARIWSQFTPTSLNLSSPGYLKDPTGNHDSWRVPNYQLVDLHVGYKFQWQHFDFQFAAHLMNVLNTEYIAEGTDQGYFDATHATVFFGQPRHFLVSMKVIFN